MGVKGRVEFPKGDKASILNQNCTNYIIKFQKSTFDLF